MRNVKLVPLTILLTLFIFLCGTAPKTETAFGSEPNSDETKTITVLGNCGMCQRTIQKAALSARAVSADWNMDTNVLTVTFDPARTTTDAIQSAVAAVGYDTPPYKAPDEVYEKLHKCCRYDRSGAKGSPKSCTERMKEKN